MTEGDVAVCYKQYRMCTPVRYPQNEVKRKAMRGLVNTAFEQKTHLAERVQ